MKKNLILLAVVSLSFLSCKEEAKNVETTIDSVATAPDHHNAMNSLDYEGTYKGSLPCADCEVIETTLVLDATSYTKEMVYKGKSKEVIKETGTYSWNEAGNTITLSGSATPNQYFVGENILFHLDSDGKRVEGDLAKLYELTKVTVDEVTPAKNEEIKANDTPKGTLKETAQVELKNSKWRLVKLHGQLVSKNKEDKRELGINFTKDGKFSAYAGCNNLFGSYELKEKETTITFSKVASTMMACPDLMQEQNLIKAIEIADNYNFDGNKLKLNKGKIATLAEFEIIK